DFGAVQLSNLVLERALSASSGTEVRSALATLSPTVPRDKMIARTLSPTVEDVRWLTESRVIERQVATAMLLDLLRRADDRQFAAILVDQKIGTRVIDTLETSAPDLLLRAASSDALPIATFVRTLPLVLAGLGGDAKVKLAKHALNRCLVCRFTGDDVGFLASMLSILGDQLDGAWAARIGLAGNIDAATASRNMVAFRKAAQPARLRMIRSIGDLAQVLRDRRSFDLDEMAVESCAAFMFDAEKVAPNALLAAAGHLLPTLLRSRSRPVSMMIAAAFPPVYRELAKADDVPELFKFIPFLDWDRCKAARHELVDAFMSSTWPPRDLALTACRANEVGKILRRVAKRYGGDDYVRRISAEVGRLPLSCRKPVEKALMEIQSNLSSRYDWRD
ncbi:MAG: hypothetical protein R3E18_07330, partial [Sphingomonadaceae bacterium]